MDLGIDLVEIPRRFSILADAVFGEHRRARLRHDLLNLPVDDDYPFDVELRMLVWSGIVNGPMLDVGANTGIYSAALQSQAGAREQYLFEPLPLLAAQLRRNFPHATVLNVAISDKTGFETIRVPMIDGRPVDTRATLNHHSEDRQNGEFSMQCELLTLDAAVSRLRLCEIGFVKIDVEGHELEVLRGASRVMRDFRPLVLIEIEVRHHQFPIQRIFEELLHNGYRGYFFRVEPPQVARLDEFDPEKDQNLGFHRARLFLKYVNNFFFVPMEREAAFLLSATSFIRDLQRSASIHDRERR